MKAESELNKNVKETKALNKALYNEIENAKVLKAVIKKHDSDATNKANEINCAIKTIKSKDKEIHNLENKTNNQQDTIKRLKADKDKLKAEKIKCEKELIKKTEKYAKKETKVLDISVSQANTFAITNNETEKTSKDIPKISDDTNSNSTLDHIPFKGELDNLSYDTQDKNNNEANDDHDNKVGKVKESENGKAECDKCEKICKTMAEMKAHREKDHQESLNYDCKLCDEIFISEEEHLKHRDSLGHKSLSKSVAKEFMERIGNSCDGCHISVTGDNTTYNFCENDGHMDTFYDIWSNRQCGSMSI